MGLLEEVGRTICKDTRLFHCAIITCSLKCLDQGFLPDYLDEPARSLGDITELLTDQEQSIYRSDSARLGEMLTSGTQIVATVVPPDYFPGTWGPGVDSSWWDDLVVGKPCPPNR